MIILASDTSTSLGSVALRLPDGMLLREGLDSQKPHSETLLPAVEKLLSRGGLTRGEIQTLAVGTGPGAFTGLRVGLATFKAWAEAAGLPIIPVVSLDAVALPVLREGTSAIVLADARKGEFYAAYYPELEQEGLPRRQGEVTLIPHDEVRGWMSALGDPDARLVGTGLPLLAERGLIGDADSVYDGSMAPDAVWILEMAEVLSCLERTVDPAGLIPFYVRPPDARRPLPGSSVTGLSDPDGRDS